MNAAAGFGGYKERPNFYTAGPPFQRWCHGWATELHRVVKPGGHVLLFGGTRTWHRLACAIEDAGFEMRDTIIAWTYATGFPKSPHHLKPAWEPILVARKPLAGTVAVNMERWGVGGIDVDGCRVGYQSTEDLAITLGKNPGREGATVTSGVYGSDRPQQAVDASGRWPTNLVLCHHPGCGNDRCVEDCHVAEMDRQSGTSVSPRKVTSGGKALGMMNDDGWQAQPGKAVDCYDDSGGASRFYPCFRFEAKASKTERPVGLDGERHPTVKPLDLMRWLVRLVSPSADQVILDPFLGSGTTAEACINEGRRWVGIERDERYWPLIEQRIARADPRADPRVLAKPSGPKAPKAKKSPTTTKPPEVGLSLFDMLADAG